MINNLSSMLNLIRIKPNNYDPTQANTSKLNTYNQKNEKLVDQAVLTRQTTSLSISNPSVLGLKADEQYTYSILLFPPKLIQESKTLQSQITKQLNYLDIPRDKSFTLKQDDQGTILVSGLSSINNNEIASKLNQSKHFKETFHLLKTAEKVLNVNGSDFTERSFMLNVGTNTLSANVDIVKKGSKEAQNDFINHRGVTDLELYNLARYGTTASKNTYVNLKLTHYKEP